MDKGDSVHRESVFGSEKWNLILLLGIALALRILLYRWTYLIAIDGTGFYLKPAHYFALGRWMDGLAIGYHLPFEPPYTLPSVTRVLKLIISLRVPFVQTLPEEPTTHLSQGELSSRWTSIGSADRIIMAFVRLIWDGYCIGVRGGFCFKLQGVYCR